MRNYANHLRVGSMLLGLVLLGTISCVAAVDESLLTSDSTGKVTFVNLDSDKDGVLSYSEFAGDEETFNSLDTDDDGKLEPEEYGAWAIEMGAPQAPENTDDLVPCLYVYQPGANIESRKECVSLVCEGGADYNDMVNDKQNGNFDLGPLLNGN